jgi:Glycosyl transferase 4-like
VTALSNGTAMERGFRQMMTANDEVQLTDRLSSGFRCQMIEAVRSQVYIPWAPPYLSQLLGLGLEEAATQSPDIIIGWYFEPYGVAASILGEMLGKPVILRHAGSDLGRLKNYSNLRPVYDRILSRAAYLVTGKDPKVTQLLIDSGVDSDRIIHARGRALDPEFFSQDILDFEEVTSEAEAWFADYRFEPELLKTLIEWNREGLKASDPIIGTYGKIAEVKGTYQLIDALNQLVEEGVPLAYRALWSAFPDRFAHAFRSS